MKKTLLILLLTLVVQAEPLCQSIDIGKVKKLYKKELKNSEPFLYARKDAFCKKIPNSSLAIVLIPYKNEMEEETVYSLSLVVALVDVKNDKIKEHFYIKSFEESDAVYIDNITLDTITYSSVSSAPSFSVLISKEGSSQVNPLSEKLLYLFEIKGKKLNRLLGTMLFFRRGENNGDGKGFSGTYSYFHNENFPKKDYPLLTFKKQYKFEDYDYSKGANKRETWNVNLGEHQYEYINNRYVLLGKKEVRAFDLKQIEAQTKKGLSFKSIVLRALLSEENMYKENVEIYNNIAYYLQKNKHNKEALVILEELVQHFSKRTVAYYNLGDAYWALGDKKRAKEAYTTYTEQMCDAGKQKRIPKVVMDRITTK